MATPTASETLNKIRATFIDHLEPKQVAHWEQVATALRETFENNGVPWNDDTLLAALLVLKTADDLDNAQHPATLVAKLLGRTANDMIKYAIMTTPSTREG